MVIDCVSIVNFEAYMQMPTLERELVTENGENGWTAYWYAHENDESMTPLPEPMETRFLDETRMFIR